MTTPKAKSTPRTTSTPATVNPASTDLVPVTLMLHPLAAAALRDYAEGENDDDGKTIMSEIASHILRETVADFVKPVEGQPRCFFVNLSVGHHMRIAGIAGDKDRKESFVLAEAILSGIRSLEALNAGKRA